MAPWPPQIQRPIRHSKHYNRLRSSLLTTSSACAHPRPSPLRPWLRARLDAYGTCGHFDPTAHEENTAPATLPFEVGNAISAMLKRRCLTIENAMAVWDAVSVIRVRLVDIDLRAALEMAARQGIYAYDAYVLQCGRQMRCPILTLDIALRRVGVKLGLHIMEVA